MKKVSLFFGAGAEINYGLPSGGKFALDIFKMDSTPDKKEFREERDKINKKSSYAKNWLPVDYEKKPISSFGRRQYETLVKSSLEYKRFEIIRYLNNFDNNVETICHKIINEKSLDVKDSFEAILEMPFGSETYGHEVKVSTALGDYNQLFYSEYFSSFLKLIEHSSAKRNVVLFRRIREFCRAILELLIGACGEELVHNLNDGIFEKKPDDIDIFDDLGSIFSLDYRAAGLAGLEMLLNYEEEEKETYGDDDLIVYFSYRVLEDIFSSALDYQSLIDSNWRYLYSPKTDWAKFCRINIFLKTTQRYIRGISLQHAEKISSTHGYYHDILDLKNDAKVVAIGTTNYNDFIEGISQESVYFLNGSTKDYYNPYLNSIRHEGECVDENQFEVPFLFTQSGVKPLTSIKMSKRYVELYNNLRDSENIAIVGYGFNSDDGHINGMFRSLIEDEDKVVTIFHYTRDFTSESYLRLKSHYQERLRLSSSENIRILKINDERLTEDGELWYKPLANNV